MGGGGGKGGGSVSVEPSAYEQAMAAIALDLYGKTGPLRGYFLEDYGNFLRPGGVSGGTVTPGTSGISNYNATPYSGGTVTPGTSGIPPTPYDSSQVSPFDYQSGFNYARRGQPTPLFFPSTQAGTTTPASQGTNYTGLASSAKYNPYNLPGYAPLYQLARGGTESQYNVARSNILGSVPRGGALAENLGNLEMSRAQQVGALPAQIATPLIQDIMNKAYGVAFNAPSQSMSGLGGAASAYTGTQQAALQGQAIANQQAMGWGAGLGSLAGLGVKAAMK